MSSWLPVIRVDFVLMSPKPAQDARARGLVANPVPGRPLLHKSDYCYNAKIIDAFSDQFIALHNQMNQATSALGEWYRIRVGQDP